VRDPHDKNKLEVTTNTGITTAVGAVNIVFAAILAVCAAVALVRAQRAREMENS
jgi:hypothetical protein